MISSRFFALLVLLFVFKNASAFGFVQIASHPLARVDSITDALMILGRLKTEEKTNSYDDRIWELSLTYGKALVDGLRPITIQSREDMAILGKLSVTDWVDLFNSRTFSQGSNRGYLYSVEATVEWAKKVESLFAKENSLGIVEDFYLALRQYLLQHATRASIFSWPHRINWLVKISRALPPDLRADYFDAVLRDISSLGLSHPLNQEASRYYNGNRSFIFTGFLEHIIEMGYDWYLESPMIRTTSSTLFFGAKRLVSPAQMRNEFQNMILRLFRNHAQAYSFAPEATVNDLYSSFLERLENRHDPVSPGRGPLLMFSYPDLYQIFPSVEFFDSLARLIVGNYFDGTIKLGQAKILMRRMNHFGLALLGYRDFAPAESEGIQQLQQFSQSILASLDEELEKKGELTGLPSIYAGTSFILQTGVALYRASNWAWKAILNNAPSCDNLLAPPPSQSGAPPSSGLEYI